MIIKGLLSGNEISKLKQHFEQSQEVSRNSFEREDDGGASIKLSVWNYAGDDVPGIISR